MSREMRWQAQNLTLGTSLPKAFASLGAYAFDEQGTRHIDYVGFTPGSAQGDGKIHELFFDSAGLHQNLISDGSVSPADQFTSIGAYIFTQDPTTQHVDFRTGSPGEVVELWWDGDWHQNRISFLSGAPGALSGPYGFSFGDKQAVCYRAEDPSRGINQHPLVLWWASGTWQVIDLTTIGASIAVGEVVGYAEAPEEPGSEALAHIIYVGPGRTLDTGPIHHVYRDAEGSWHDDSANVPQIQALNSVRPAALVDARGIHHVFFAAPAPGRAGAETLLHELSRDLAGTWTEAVITPEGAGGPESSALLSAYEFVDQGTLHVPYPSDHGEFFDSWWSDHLGWSVQVLGVATGAPPPVGGVVGYLSTATVQSQPVARQYLDYRDDDHDVVELSWAPLETVAPQIVDVTGEGNLDVVAFGDAGVWVARGDGQGNFQDPELAVENFGYAAGSWHVARHPRFVTDLTGNRRGDIVGFGDAGVWTALSSGGGAFRDRQPRTGRPGLRPRVARRQARAAARRRKSRRRGGRRRLRRCRRLYGAERPGRRVSVDGGAGRG